MGLPASRFFHGAKVYPADARRSNASCGCWAGGRLVVKPWLLPKALTRGGISFSPMVFEPAMPNFRSESAGSSSDNALGADCNGDLGADAGSGDGVVAGSWDGIHVPPCKTWPAGHERCGATSASASPAHSTYSLRLRMR